MKFWEGHRVHLQSMGHAPTYIDFYQLFCPENTLEITYSRSVPLNSLGYICYWSLVSFASAVLVLKLLKVFQFEWRPRVTYVMAGCQVTSLWMVVSDLCLSFSTVNMSSCSSSKFPLAVSWVRKFWHHLMVFQRKHNSNSGRDILLLAISKASWWELNIINNLGSTRWQTRLMNIIRSYDSTACCKEPHWRSLTYTQPTSLSHQPKVLATCTY